MTKKNYITASKTKRLQQHTSDSLTGTLLNGRNLHRGFDGNLVCILCNLGYGVYSMQVNFCFHIGLEQSPPR